MKISEISSEICIYFYRISLQLVLSPFLFLVKFSFISSIICIYFYRIFRFFYFYKWRNFYISLLILRGQKNSAIFLKTGFYTFCDTRSLSKHYVYFSILLIFIIIPLMTLDWIQQHLLIPQELFRLKFLGSLPGVWQLVLPELKYEG